MKKMLFAAGLAVVAAPAFAQAAGPFQGPYIGVQGGWQQDRQTLETSSSNTVSRTTQSGDGFAYGGQVGYDARVGTNLVLGGEVAATGRTGRTNFTGFDLSQGRTISATARLGYLTGPDGLVYLRGGYSNARFNLNDSTGRLSEDRDGWTIGAGYEKYLVQNVSARIEYNYSDFGRDRLSDSIGPNAELKYRRHAVTAGLNFRF